MSNEQAITLEFINCLAESIGATHGLTDSEIDTLVAKFTKHHETMEEYRKNDSGHFNLPYQDLTAVNDLLQAHSGKWKDLVVLGASGAVAGAQVLTGSLLPPFWNERDEKARGKAPRLHILDNLDPMSLESVWEIIDAKKTLFVVISRSGQTPETNAVLLWLLTSLKANATKTAPTKQIILATEGSDSPLAAIAKEEKLQTLELATTIADHYAALGPEALLVTGLVGVDIEAVLAGAKAMDERTRHDDAMKNPAYLHSLIHYLLTRKRRKTIHAIMSFSDRLKPVTRWYNHLLAVSLGKLLNRKGKAVHVGPGPAECFGPCGSYDQMQLWQEGPFDKVITFITVQDHGKAFAIPSYDGDEAISCIADHDGSELIDASYHSAVSVITSAGRPSLRLDLQEVSPETVGGLIYLLQLSTVMSAELYGIDPFTYPGIDNSRQNLAAQFGRSGYEDRAEAIKSYKERPVKSC
jgi:glucose-6-phosphate isomerase